MSASVPTTTAETAPSADVSSPAAASTAPRRAQSTPSPASGVARVLSPARGGLVTGHLLSPMGGGPAMRLSDSSSPRSTVVVGPRSPANTRKPPPRQARKWATPATPVFTGPPQTPDTSMRTESETPRQQIPNPALNGAKGSASSPQQADGDTSSAPAVALFDESAQETSIADESLGSAFSEGGPPLKPRATVPTRRLSAFLQERVDVFEGGEAEPDLRPMRRFSAIAGASPMLSGSISSAPDTSMDLLSPVIGVHEQSQHSIRMTPESGLEEASIHEMNDSNLAAAYFGGTTSPAQAGRISFGAMPSDVQSRNASGAHMFSPVYSSTGEGIGIDNSSILAALNRPSFLSDDGGDQIRVDLMEDEDLRRISTLNGSFRSPQAQHGHSVAAGSSPRVYTATATTTPSASIAPIIASTPTPAVATSSTTASPASLFSPTTYFAERSAPLGSVSHTKNRPSFNSPEFLTSQAVLMDEFFSPVTEAQVLREVTPNASRRASPYPALSFGADPANSAKRSSTPSGSVVRSNSTSRIPVLRNGGRSPDPVGTGGQSRPITTSASPMPSSPSPTRRAASATRISSPRTISSPHATTIASPRDVSSPPSVSRVLSSSLSPAGAPYSPQSGVVATQGGTGFRTGLFGASPSPIKHHRSPERRMHVITSSSPSATQRQQDGSPLSHRSPISPTRTQPQRSAPLTPHDIATLATARGHFSPIKIDSSDTVVRVDSVTSTATTTVLLSSPTFSIIATSPTSPVRTIRASSAATTSAPASPIRATRASPIITAVASPARPTIRASPQARIAAASPPRSLRAGGSPPRSTIRLAASSPPRSVRASPAGSPASPIRRALPQASSPLSSPLTLSRALLARAGSDSTSVKSLRRPVPSSPGLASPRSGGSTLRSLAYPFSIHVSHRLQQLHRFALFEVDPTVESSTLAAAAEAYVRQVYPADDTGANPPLVLHRLYPHPTRRNTWTLSFLVDLSIEEHTQATRRDTWMNAFISLVARPCCSRVKTSAEDGSSPLFAVRFLEQRPYAWHQQILAQQ